MILDRSALANRLASIEIDAHRIKKGEDCYKREGAGGNERHACRFAAEVEKRSCNCADVDGEFELCYS